MSQTDFEFKLPDIGEGLVEGEIVKWFVNEGDTVKENQPLASVLTDKAEVEIPSPKTGTIVTLHGKPGQKVKVHAPFALFRLSGAPAGPVTTSTAKDAAASDYVFNLPDIGEGLVEGELVQWHVSEGSQVKENQPIAAVLTDKAEVEIPSPKSGRVKTLHAQPGQKIKVHTPLMTLLVVGQTQIPIATAPDAPMPTSRSTAAIRDASKTVLAAPSVRKLAQDQGIDLMRVQGTGPDGRILAVDVQNFRPTIQATPLPGRSAATAAVKALAESLGVNIDSLSGSGPGGRIVESDVRAAKPRPSPVIAEAKRSIPAEGEVIIPFVGIRRKIAEKLQFSKRTAAHVTHMDEADMTALIALREELKPAAVAEGVKLSYLPFIIRAVTKTLAEYPAFNSSINDEAGEIIQKSYYNIGIAVAAPQVLVVPNIKNAQTLSMYDLARTIGELAEKVRANKIDVSALRGGTFTITNIGSIGGLFATPIINHPEVAILGLMKMQKRPVWREGTIVARDMMNLVLSFDHRMIDGADAAQFMNTLIHYLENPRTLF
jgi:pyruvate dehydrogenase E2 component (dihydrolipoamide acetyltransferase)